MPRDRLLEGGHQRRLPEGRTAGEVCFPTVEGLGRACQAEGRARGCGLAGVLGDPGTPVFLGNKREWGRRGQVHKGQGAKDWGHHFGWGAVTGFSGMEEKG